MTIHTDRLTTALDRRASGGGDSLETSLALDGSIPRVAAQRVLDNDRRREVLRCLLTEEGPLEVRTLVARIADTEHDPTAVTPLLDLRQRIHVSLCQTHLPLLEKHHILTYDRDHGHVFPDVALPVFESVLE
ncbi:DUF7344 domain-containing protein [Natronorubrum bangense]|uniref:DUF7344 domain-containing protein n=2 Tax=Natronorubrum bangense TaxID=61858 RepID=L9WI69_9EURY|nr:hypothetical protein [Natronorubrum bangense]ELY49057.1 hypothetical protein C494_09449 [Natronorubrum bangense JCM 10635]QCC54059.1 hypothetical protein DV706_05870 [Natronorubrum bangense]